jgi:hypothetical protein
MAAAILGALGGVSASLSIPVLSFQITALDCTQAGARVGQSREEVRASFARSALVHQSAYQSMQGYAPPALA